MQNKVGEIRLFSQIFVDKAESFVVGLVPDGFGGEVEVVKAVWDGDGGDVFTQIWRLFHNLLVVQYPIAVGEFLHPFFAIDAAVAVHDENGGFDVEAFLDFIMP